MPLGCLSCRGIDVDQEHPSSGAGYVADAKSSRHARNGHRVGVNMVYADSLPRNTERGIQQLSPVDHSAILNCINPKAFWFPAPGLAAAPLKAALGKLLNEYPLLAGRMSSDGGPGGLGPLRKRLACRVSLCNAGVEFVEVSDPQHRSMQDFPLGAMARTGFTHMAAQAILPDFFSTVDIDELIEGREPLVKIRLTQLSCGGSILAMTLSHAVVDGHSAAMFLNDWSRVYRQEIGSGAPAPVQQPSADVAQSPGQDTGAVHGGVPSSGPAPRETWLPIPPPVQPPSTPDGPSSEAEVAKLGGSALAAEAAAEPLDSSTPAPAASAAAAATAQPLDLSAPAAAAAAPAAAAADEMPAAASQGQAAAGTLTSLTPVPGTWSSTEVTQPAAAQLAAVTTAATKPAQTLSTELQPSAARAAAPRPDVRVAPTMDRSMLLIGAPRQAVKQQAVLQYTAVQASKQAGLQGNGADMKGTDGVSLGKQMPAALPASRADVTGAAAAAQPGPLPCLALQQLPPPGWLPALRGLGSLIGSFREQEQRWPGIRTDLSSMVLHMPPLEVQRLKALASSATPGSIISTNDAVASLVWTLMCQLRGRPLPGQAPPGCCNSMALAVDLRRNGLKGVLPLNLVANATWCLHVPNGEAEAAAAADDDDVCAGPAERGLRAAGRGGSLSAESDSKAGRSLSGRVTQLTADSAASGSKLFEVALKQGAAKIRASLQEFRSRGPGSGWEVVDLAAAQCQAPFSSQLHLACNVMNGQDAMLSSWQFPYWDADFGAGGPLRYMGALHPTPPWSAAVMTAHPSHGGMYLFMVVPTSARIALRSSPVLQALIPGARFA